MKPEYSKSLGHVQVAVFNDEGRRSVSLQRRYKDGNEWKLSKTLFPADVPVAIRLLSEAESHLFSVEE